MFGFKTRRRNRLRAQPFPEAWLNVLCQNVPYYDRLSAAEQEELRGAIQVFVDEKNFEGCGGLELTDEIKVTIAAYACILLLHRQHDFYPRLESAALEGAALVEYLGRVKVGEPVSAALEKKFFELLRRYFFIGGMPEAVRAYAERQDLLEVQRIQTGLVATVQDDFAKYGPRWLHELMRTTYRHVAGTVGRKVKYVNVSREDRSGDVRRAFELLAQSRMIHPVFRTAANGLPLGAERDDRHFKALFLDVGLANRLCGLDLEGAEDLITVNEGAQAEQYVGQQLLAAGLPFDDPQLFYWSREAKNANAEVDYVISRHQEILPVEVKAGKTGTLRSLFQFLQEKGRRRAVRFHLRPPVLEEVRLPGTETTTAQLLSLPLYLTGQLDRLLAEAFDK